MRTVGCWGGSPRPTLPKTKQGTVHTHQIFGVGSFRRTKQGRLRLSVSTRGSQKRLLPEELLLLWSPLCTIVAKRTPIPQKLKAVKKHRSWGGSFLTKAYTVVINAVCENSLQFTRNTTNRYPENTPKTMVRDPKRRIENDLRIEALTPLAPTLPHTPQPRALAPTTATHHSNRIV